MVLAVLMSVVMMFAAFGIDFGRMYTFSAQLKTLTDAAALAAAIEIRNGGTETNARNRALALVAGNRVDGPNQATMTGGDIVFGTFNPATNAFTAGTYAGANAVQSTARYTARWTLAQIFGVSTKALTQRSVAMVGSQLSNGCMKPFAFPYGSLLTAIGRSPTNLTYNLTPADIAALTANTPLTWAMTTGAAATTANGNFGLVGFNPGYAAAQNKNTYLASIIPPGCNSGNRVAVGDIIPAITGIGQGLILDNIALLCTGRNGNQQSWTCSGGGVEIQVPIYDSYSGSGNNAGYRVKYVGAFRMTSVNFNGNNNSISGYLTKLLPQSTGSFSPYAGPVGMTGLVQ